MPNAYWEAWAITTGLDWNEQPLNPADFGPDDDLIRKWKEYHATNA